MHTGVFRLRRRQAASVGAGVFRDRGFFPRGKKPHMHASDAAEFFKNSILESASHCIPQRELRERKSTHPWLNAETELLVKSKTDAEGTPGAREAAETCSAGIRVGFLEYT